MDPEPSSVGIHVRAIPDVLLQEVFSLLPMEDRCLRLPLVCRKWRDALDQPSPAWQDVVVAARKLQLDFTSDEKRRRMAAWFSSRAPQMRSLTLRLDGPCSLAPLGVHHFLSCALTACPVPLLRRVELVGLAVPASSLVALQCCTGLRMVRVKWLVPMEQNAPLGSMLMSLHYGGFNGGGPGAAGPSQQLYIDMALEPLWRLAQLEVLEVSCLGGISPGPCPDFVPSLTRLRALELPCLTSLPPSISGLTDLRSLRLQRSPCREFPEVVTQLTGLTQLVLDRGPSTSVFAGADGGAGGGWPGPPPHVPRGISALTGLLDLQLTHTFCTENVSSLAGLTSLELVQCRHGLQHSGFPLWVSALTSLRRLSLWSAEICTVPPEVGALQSLQELLLSGSPHRMDLSERITTLRSLRLLALRVGRTANGNGIMRLRLAVAPPGPGEPPTLWPLTLGPDRKLVADMMWPAAGGENTEAIEPPCGVRRTVAALNSVVRFSG